MKPSIHQNRILILEEQRIIGYDLEKQLKKRGYCVSYEKTYKDIQTNFLFGLSDIVITSLRSLKIAQGLNKMNGWNFPKGLGESLTCDFRTDTIIIDKGIGEVKCFEKPYNTEDIVSFISILMNKNKQKRSNNRQQIK